MNRPIRRALLLAAVAVAGCTTPPDPRPAVYVEAERLLGRGVAAYADDAYPDAAGLFAQALSAYQSVDDRAGMLRAYLNLTETALALGNLELARDHLARATVLADELGAAADGRRLAQLAVSIALKAGDYPAALRLIEPLLPAAGEPADAIALALFSDRALLALRLGEPVEPWLARYRQALTRADAGPLASARLYRLEGEALRLAGDLDGARARLEQALAGFKRAAHRPGIAATLEGLGLVAKAGGDTADARESLRRALYVRVWTFDRAASRRLLGELIAIEEAAGDRSAAQRYRDLAEALSAARFDDWKRLREDFGVEGP